jgi:hypothetical protein
LDTARLLWEPPFVLDMKARSFLSLATIAGNALAQEAFEPLDFNVTEALIANGVDISALPELANITEKRSLFSPCAVAVSEFYQAPHPEER